MSHVASRRVRAFASPLRRLPDATNARGRRELAGQVTCSPTGGGTVARVDGVTGCYFEWLLELSDEPLELLDVLVPDEAPTLALDESDPDDPDDPEDDPPSDEEDDDEEDEGDPPPSDDEELVEAVDEPRLSVL